MRFRKYRQNGSVTFPVIPSIDVQIPPKAKRDHVSTHAKGKREKSFADGNWEQNPDGEGANSEYFEETDPVAREDSDAHPLRR